MKDLVYNPKVGKEMSPERNLDVKDHEETKAGVQSRGGQLAWSYNKRDLSLAMLD